MRVELHCSSGLNSGPVPQAESQPGRQMEFAAVACVRMRRRLGDKRLYEADPRLIQTISVRNIKQKRRMGFSRRWRLRVALLKN